MSDGTVTIPHPVVLEVGEQRIRAVLAQARITELEAQVAALQARLEAEVSDG